MNYSSKVDERPAMQFYLKDWLADTRVLNLEERGWWIDTLAFMWRSPERGVLLMQNGCRPDAEAMRNLYGIPAGASERIAESVLRKGVASKRDDGAIYCRRMVRIDAEEKAERAAKQKAARARWDADAMHNDASPYSVLRSPSPSPAPSPEEKDLSGQEPDKSKGKAKPKIESRPKGYQKQVWDLFRQYFEAAYSTPWFLTGGKDARGTKTLWDRVAGDLAALRAKLEVALKLWRVRPKFYPFPTDTLALAAKWNVYCDARLRAIQQNGKAGPATSPTKRLCPFGSEEYKSCTGSDDAECRGCPKHGATRAAELPGSERKPGESSAKVTVTSEPVLDEQGQPVLDRHGRPLMRIVTTSQPFSSIAEILRGKGQA